VVGGPRLRSGAAAPAELATDRVQASSV